MVDPYLIIDENASIFYHKQFNWFKKYLENILWFILYWIIWYTIYLSDTDLIIY